MAKILSPEIGRAAIRALIQEGSPLGPLKVMAKHMGRFFQIPLPGFRPYVVFGPEANRKVLVTERDKVSWRNTDPVTDLLGRGVLIVDGDEHDHYRKLMEPPLHPSQLPAYTARFIFHTDRVSAPNASPTDARLRRFRMCRLAAVRARVLAAHSVRRRREL